MFPPFKKLSLYNDPIELITTDNTFNHEIEKWILIDEAISDIVLISQINDFETAKKLIKEQFIVMNKLDAEILMPKKAEAAQK